MNVITKQDIINAIQRTAKGNGGKPLGRDRFSGETGIKPYDWQKYWARFGDAQKEAGFAPNTLTPKYSDDFLFNKLISLTRKIGKVPTFGELQLEKNNNLEFPTSGCFFETKEQKIKLIKKLSEWCQKNKGYDDIIALCNPFLQESIGKDNIEEDSPIKFGEVYLFKSGRYYKIGKTYDTV